MPTNMNNNNKKDFNINTEHEDSMIAKMLAGAMPAAALDSLIEMVDMPEASPMDLLSISDYQRMDKYLDRHFGPLREFIDENYVALLMAISAYEKVDFYAKIKAHLVHNLKNR